MPCLFQQQLQLDQYRSVYTRAHLQPGQILLITSELQEEQIGVLAKEWVQTPVEKILARNEEMIGEVMLNGEPLAGTLQIPEELLLDGDNTLEIALADESDMQNCLVSSTVQLHSAKAAGNGTEYKVTARGKNVLTFRGLDGEVTILDEAGNEVDFAVEVLEDLTWIEFNGRGVFTIRI